MHRIAAPYNSSDILLATDLIAIFYGIALDFFAKTLFIGAAAADSIISGALSKSLRAANLSSIIS